MLTVYKDLMGLGSAPLIDQTSSYTAVHQLGQYGLQGEAMGKNRTYFKSLLNWILDHLHQYHV